jgi:DNA-binding transcriptional MerR regulator
MAMAGITQRQLQWWDERGVVVPQRLGHKRFYSPDDALLIMVLAELRRRGFPLQLLRRLKHKITAVIERSEYEPERAYLITDKKRVDCVASLEELQKFQRDQNITVVYLAPLISMVKGRNDAR